MIAKRRLLSFVAALAVVTCIFASQARADRYTSQKDLLPPPVRIEDGPPAPKLDHAERAYLVKLARQAMTHSAKTDRLYEPADVPGSLKDKDYIVYVSARISGKMIDSAGGEGGSIAQNVAKAALAVVKDGQFGQDKAAGVAESVIELNIAGPGQVLPFPRLEQVTEAFTPGIHGLAARTGRTTARFKDSVAPAHGFTGEMVMQGVLSKLGLTAKQLADNRAKVIFFRYRAVHLLERPAPQGYIELIRCAELIDQSTVSAERLDHLIELIGQHLRRRQLEAGLFNYLYSPSAAAYQPGNNNAPRQAGTAWSMALLAGFSGRVEFELSALRAVAAARVRYLDDAKTAACSGYDFEPGKESLGSTALLLCAMVDLPNNKAVAELRDKLAAGILSLQRPDGSLKLFFYDREDDGNQFYYPGEALLALMKMHKQTGQQKYLDAVERAFAVYHKMFQETPRMSFAPWHCQAWAMAYEATGKKQYADFVFQLADYMLGFQADEAVAAYPDMVGAFVSQSGQGGVSSATFSEGIVPAHRVAVKLNDQKRAARYATSMRLAARFIDQLTFKQLDSFYCISANEVLGGVKSSPNDHAIRIDNCQHALLALMGIREQLFGPRK